MSLEELLAAGGEPARLPALLRRVGTPDRLERTPIAGGELQIWGYPGLAFTIRSAGGAERLTRIRVTERGHRTADGLRVGMTREALTGIRGQPSGREGRVEIHDGATEGASELRVSYTDEGTVESLEWRFPGGETGSGAG